MSERSWLFFKITIYKHIYYFWDIAHCELNKQMRGGIYLQWCAQPWLFLFGCANYNVGVAIFGSINQRSTCPVSPLSCCSLFPHCCHPHCLFLLLSSSYSPGSLLTTHDPPCEQVLTMVVVGAWGSSSPSFHSLSLPAVFALVIIPIIGSCLGTPIVFS